MTMLVEKVVVVVNVKKRKMMMMRMRRWVTARRRMLLIRTAKEVQDVGISKYRCMHTDEKLKTSQK